MAVGVCSDQSPRDFGCCMVRVLALVYTYNDYYPHFLSFLSAGPCDAFTDHHRSYKKHDVKKRALDLHLAGRGALHFSRFFCARLLVAYL